ncbi:hypothetical protein HA48_15580 [Pantoea wallisii]|uniref:Endonuclease GajA/Old nuclease/RecF-like AAA domain-containing protein n=1 Tax=Pantoea wallisii TaxID=1076551 RepID=A0A1X1D486_9GAMM|nr:AAA family ATPase [Pantoea wallisii]ORM71483.1 hypothetical protein HA48_15580 [Pantoea wallisii]
MEIKYTNAKAKKELGFNDNKRIQIKAIKAINLTKFRSFSDRRIELGGNITVLIGRNGTMKTSVMGLIAHPFGSESKDAFGKPLKTSINEVFKFSTKYDLGPDKYDIYFDVGKKDFLKETVTVRLAKDGSERHRIVISGHEQGDGNFTYNTSFLNLKRLLPLVGTNAKPDDTISALTDYEKDLQRDFYESVLPSMDYEDFTAVYEANTKSTFAPCGENAKYDYQAISSGEDNLGAIFNKLVGFQRAYDNKSEFGNGILCIDEFESGLHPIAQLNLFNYLFKWSNKYNVQIIITTHSLHLIQNINIKHQLNIEKEKIILNFISKANVGDDRNYNIIKNPDYNSAYKELTFEDPKEIIKHKKINILCEDKIAIHFIKALIQKKDILSLINFNSNLNSDPENTGTSYTLLTQLCSNFPFLLNESFVIFDADVKGKTDKIKDKNTFLILPDSDNLALEKRIICFILSLPGDDKFFKQFQTEKEIFINQFKSAGMKSISVKDLKSDKIPVKTCKKWAETDIVRFKQYVTYYAKTVDSSEFKREFYNRINFINKIRGLPSIGGGN